MSQEGFCSVQIDLPPSEVSITYDIKGKVAGRAGWKGTNLSKERAYYLKFNPEAIRKHWNEMVARTIPHEVAHLVAFLRPDLGAKGHNGAWKLICLHLGGEAQRCHSYSLEGARKTRKFLYRVGGYEFELGLVRHRKLQKGARYIFPKAGLIFGKENYLREVRS